MCKFVFNENKLLQPILSVHSTIYSMQDAFWRAQKAAHQGWVHLSVIGDFNMF